MHAFPVFIKAGFGENTDAFPNLLKGFFQLTVDIFFNFTQLFFSDQTFFRQFLRVDTIQRRSFPDPFVHKWLCEIRLITLIVTVPAVTDHIDYNVFAKGLPVLGCYPGDVNRGFRVFSVYMKDGNHQHFRHIGGVTCRSCIFRKCCVADLIVNHKMDCTTGLVTV